MIKKNFILIFLSCSLALPAFSYIEPPDWSEFCPPQYINAVYNNYKRKIPVLVAIPLAISIVGMPFVAVDTGHLRSAYVNNYWVKRKQEFENEIESCRNIKDTNELMYKYTTIRQIEYNKNQQHENEIMQARQDEILNNQYYYRW